MANEIYGVDTHRDSDNFIFYDTAAGLGAGNLIAMTKDGIKIGASGQSMGLELLGNVSLRVGAGVIGNVFYVNGGSDGPTDNNYDGLTAATPKQTLTAALALCTSNANDIIYVLNYGSNARAAETWPIVVSKDQVHIIGIGHKANKWATVTATGSNKTAFSITGQRVEIAGLEIGGTAAGSGAGIQITDGMWGTYIHDCWFGVADGAGTNGVYVAAGADAPYLRVEHCEFGKALLGSGVLIAGNATRGTITNNLFLQNPVCAISVTGSAVGLKILDNKIQMLDDTTGHGVNLAAGTSVCYIDGNHAASKKAAATADYAWIDASTDNMWGLNYSGIVADLPA